ncbi:hypothetical protein ZIOFF_056257 [Zingiber officinale]|uniref:Uncharacterized protein n=1 Tax=Zingiber officinale TaxID=94328 RepID=A0A8J5FHW8_ZINOF|nr:hypothetical protein ZIOFF_056257 [Zingiber officinale]
MIMPSSNHTVRTTSFPFLLIPHANINQGRRISDRKLESEATGSDSPIHGLLLRPLVRSALLRLPRRRASGLPRRHPRRRAEPQGAGGLRVPQLAALRGRRRRRPHRRRRRSGWSIGVRAVAEPVAGGAPRRPPRGEAGRGRRHDRGPDLGSAHLRLEHHAVLHGVGLASTSSSTSTVCREGTLGAASVKETTVNSWVVQLEKKEWDPINEDASVVSAACLPVASRFVRGGRRRGGRVEQGLGCGGKCPSIASVISAHGCWMYGKCATENDEVNAFLKGDVAVDIPVTLYGTDRNKNVSKSHSYYEQGYYQQKTGFMGYLMLIAYQTSAGAVVLTDFVFWALLVPLLSVEHFKLDLLMGCMHTLNLVFLLLDTALNSLPFPWFRMAYFTLWSCIYVIFQWVLHACGFSWWSMLTHKFLRWPYPFLKLSTPWAPLWYFCLALVHIPCYGMYSLLVSSKNSILSQIFSHAYRRP